MCGISGILLSQQRPNQQDLLRMTSVLHHRGPNDRGIWHDQNVGLGHTRLSIIDLTATGHQPMVSDRNQAVIVFNGEIYNFRDIRPRLESLGYHFKSRTDTEAVLHAYEHYDVRCLKDFEGMFAFAIWAPWEKSLFLARDRLGEKPLYYYFDDHRFAFSSEINALL